MATFTHHDDDGKITQSNTVYDHDGYDKKLFDAGQTQFVVTPENKPLHHGQWRVHKGTPKERPQMGVAVSRTRIKAGGTDAAVFTGVPKRARIRVFTGGMLLFDEPAQDSSFDLPIPVPCVYAVRVELWPYADYQVEIEATS